MGKMVNLAEQFKYELLWETQYRNRLRFPFQAITYLLDYGKDAKTYLEFGCGQGRVAQIMARMGKDVRMVDIASNCLDQTVADELGDRFVCSPIKDYRGNPADIVYCADVLEHIQPEDLEDSLNVIRDHTQGCAIFIISHKEDTFQGKNLHLSVMPKEKWELLIFPRFRIIRKIWWEDTSLWILGTKS